MNEVANNNKRIAKNTLFMYIRLMLVLCINLFTVRIVLQALGDVDYGLNNVVGGVVSMFSFISTTLAGASMRFFSFEIGKKDQEGLKKYFAVTFWCYVFLCLIIVILAETIGLWFVANKLVIPSDRMTAAMWVYQFSILGSVLSFLTIPFNSLILAHEKMDFYAYLGIAEVVLKLLVAYLLFVSDGDRLILYAILMFLSSGIVSSIYIGYDLIHYSESRIKWFWNKAIFKSVFSYSGWSLFGAVSLVFRSQGINILINMFFGPVYNTARAIAYQVNNAVNTFVTGFSQAVKPQQTKYYAAEDYDMCMALTYRATRMCYYLIFVLSVPLIMEAGFILNLWLGEVSDVTVLFTQLVILVSVVEAITTPLKGLISSTGIIKYNQIINSVILIAIFPVSWLLFKLGFPAYTTMLVSLIASILCHIVRVIICIRLTTMTMRNYTYDALLPILKVTLIGIIPPVALFCSMSDGWIRFISILFVSLVSSVGTIWFLGLTQSERIYIKNATVNKLAYIKRHDRNKR